MHLDEMHFAEPSFGEISFVSTYQSTKLAQDTRLPLPRCKVAARTLTVRRRTVPQ